MFKKCFAMGIVALAMSLSTTTEAAPISTLYSTGVDAAGLVLAPGSGATDPHWTVTESADGSFTAPGAAVLQTPNGAWFAPEAVGTPGAGWISIVDVGSGTGAAVSSGTYRYVTTFDLTGFDESTAAIAGVLSPDDLVTAVLLNGVSQGITGNDFAIELAFAINSDFIAGVNTLEFTMFNRNGGGTPGVPSPHGLRVELSGTADVIPEPSSLLLTALGLLGMAGFRRRRHSK